MASKLVTFTLACATTACLFAAPCAAKDTPVPAPNSQEPVSAADRENARHLMDLGDVKIAEGDLLAALEAYRGADDIMGVTTTGLAVGQTLAKLGRLIEARDKLIATSHIPVADGESKPLANAREQARKQQDQLADRIPTLTFQFTGLEPGAAVTIRIDGTEVAAATMTLPQRVDPREHKITASCPNYEDLVVDVSVSEKESRVVSLAFRPKVKVVPPPPPPVPKLPPDDGLSPLVFIGAGIAGGGVLLGSIFGGASLAIASDVEGQCNNNLCPASAESDADTSLALAHVSTASFVIAGVGAGIGVVGLIMTDQQAKPQPSAEPAPPAASLRVEPIIGLGHFGLRGQF